MTKARRRGENSRRTMPAAAAPAPESSEHVPVLLDAVLTALAPRDGEAYVDGTLGGGGYSAGLLAAARCRVFGIDRDPEALQRGASLAARHPGRLTLLEGRFGDMERLVRSVSPDPIAGVALDLGVSSQQLDNAERGFSFRLDGPLDMRMGRDGSSAADLVADLEEGELAELIRDFGEERYARRVARAIVAARRRAPFAAPASSPMSYAPRSRSASPASIRPPAPFRPCASRSMTSSASSTAAWLPPNAC